MGVLTYILLTGEPPFSASTPDELVQKIQDGNINMRPFSHFYQKGSLIKDFILKCLEYNPKSRLTAAKLLGHDWITIMLKNEEGLTTEEHSKIIYNMFVFKNANIFQCNVISYLQGINMQSGQIDLLKKQFNLADKD